MMGVMSLARSLIGFFLCFGVIIPTLADDACAKASTDGEHYQCSMQQTKSAEDELNKQYIAAKKRIAHEYGDKPKLAADYLHILLDSQRGWLKYRDGQCNLESYLAEEGTATHESLYSKCISRVDMERAQQLKEIPYE